MPHCHGAIPEGMRGAPMPRGDGAQHMGCVHCKHCQGQPLLHFAQASPLGAPRTFALLQAEILVPQCCSRTALGNSAAVWAGC